MVIAIAGNKSDLNDLREVRARGKNIKKKLQSWFDIPV